MDQPPANSGECQTCLNNYDSRYKLESWHIILAQDVKNIITNDQAGNIFDAHLTKKHIL